MKKWFLLIAFLVGILVWGASSAAVLAASGADGPGFQARPTPSDNDVNSVARQMYCPVCENTPLDVCPTQACAEWRELIRQKLIEGWSETQIKEYFNLQYGDRVLAEPPLRGLNWLIYLLPPVVILGAAGLLFWSLWRKRLPAASKATQQDQAAPPDPNSRDPYLERIEEELRRRQE